MMRRILLLVTVALVMAAMMMASAMPAFALEIFLQASPHSSCVGQAHSTTNQVLPGHPGAFHEVLAHDGSNGELMSRFAHAGDPGSPTRNAGAALAHQETGTIIVCFGEPETL
jgi:hypothetical protein